MCVKYVNNKLYKNINDKVCAKNIEYA